MTAMLGIHRSRQHTDIPITTARSPVPLCRKTPDHHLWRFFHCFLWQGGCGDPCSLSLRCGAWGRAMARGHSWAGLTQQASPLGHQGPPAVWGHATHMGHSFPLSGIYCLQSPPCPQLSRWHYTLRLSGGPGAPSWRVSKTLSWGSHSRPKQ